MKAIITTIREIGDDFEEFIEYLEAQNTILAMSGYPPPWNISLIRKEGRSTQFWIDKYRGWKTTSIMEFVKEGKEE